MPLSLPARGLKLTETTVQTPHRRSIGGGSSPRSPRIKYRETIHETPRLSPRGLPNVRDISLDVSRRSLDIQLGEGAANSAGEEVVRDVYRRHASEFFDDLRAWFTKEARSLRKAAERQVEGDQLAALRERVEQLEAGAGAFRVPASAADAAAGAVTSPRAVGSPSGRGGVEAVVALDASVRALCRAEAKSALEQLRCELLGGNLLCDELLSGDSAWRPALEQLLDRACADRDYTLNTEVIELRASIDGAVAAATAAASAEIGQLDGAFRSSLAAEVRELGSVCEGVRARLEALDHSAAEHIGRLSARLTELEDQKQDKAAPPHPVGGPPISFMRTLPKERPPPELKMPVLQAKCHGAAPSSSSDLGGIAVAVGGGLAGRAIAAEGNTTGGSIFAGLASGDSAQNHGVAMQEPGVNSSKRNKGCCLSNLSDSTVKQGPVLDERCLDGCVGPAGGETLPSTPPKRHVPPSTAAPLRSSPRWESSASMSNHKVKQWSSCTSPRCESRGGC